MNFNALDSCRSRCYSTALEDRNPVLEETSPLMFSGVPVCLLTHQPVPSPSWLCEVHGLLIWANLCIRALEKPRKTEFADPEVLPVSHSSAAMPPRAPISWRASQHLSHILQQWSLPALSFSAASNQHRKRFTCLLRFHTAFGIFQ